MLSHESRQLASWLIFDVRQKMWSRPAANRVGAVINLSEHPSNLEAFQAVGIEACWVPLPTDVPPTDESRERCVEALPRAFAFVSDQISKRRRVLVHCYAGKDRTGMLLALFIAKEESLSAQAAIERVRTVRPLAITAPGREALALEVLPRVLEKLV